VEVVVTDHRHNPVTGLPAEAFRLEEGGERQRVVSFQAVDLSGSAPESAKSGPPRVSTNAVGATAPPPRTFAVVFDDGHLGPAGALRAREASEQLITQHTRPGDQVILIAPEEGLVRSVAMPGGRATLAALTSSLHGRREAAAVLEKARSRRRRLLSALAAALDALPGAGIRKSVLLVSEGFVYEPGDPLTYEVIAASQRANAVVHFLDVRGLTVGSRPDGLRQQTAPDRSRSASRGDSTGAEILATITGGYVIRNVNDLAEALDRLSREASHHYLLGYHPPGERRSGRLRRIRVGVDRPNVLVQARKGFYDAPDARLGPDQETSTLDAGLRDALRSPSLIRQIPLRLTAVALAPAGDGQVQVTIASEASAKGLKLARLPDGSRISRLDAALEIRHEQPQASQVASLERLVIRVPRGAQAEEGWLPFQRPFTLPPGRARVKLVVRDRGSGAMGTVVHPLQVPDAARFRISSPILSDIPEGEGVKPPRIVARRSFPAGCVLYCYFEVFPGPGISGQTGTAYEVVDRRGKVRLRGALPRPVRRDGGGLGRLVEIPLTRIGPGEYELVLDLAGEVAGGTAQLREPFSVTKPPRFNDDLYRGALSAYLEGDFQGAITTLLQWPARQVLAAAKRLPQTEDRLRATALLLHTDLAMVLRRHAHKEGAETHLTIGRALLEAAPLPDLHREWLMALAYAHQASYYPAEALAFYTECARAFPEVGEARLGAGTLHERIAFLPDGFPRGNLNVRPRPAAREAERWYREALRVQPSLTEARLRLARVLQRTDRVDEAVHELSLVVESSHDATLRALAHLFWGEIVEARGDVDGAIEHYRAALAADGDLQVAALGLAQALHQRDGRRAAVDALVPALGDGGGTTPLLAYRRGPQRLSTSPLREMRSRLQAGAGAAP
jgi:VWFA-related protein